MKKLFVVVVALTMVSAVAFAQSCEKMPSPAKEMAEGVGKATEFVGKVISVTVANPTKGVMDSTVKVADDMGNPVSYTVNSAATIVDASMNVISLNQLKAGEAVKVESVTTDAGKKEAKSISKM